jgi:hypothetical protein
LARDGYEEVATDKPLIPHIVTKPPTGDGCRNMRIISEAVFEPNREAA